MRPIPSSQRREGRHNGHGGPWPSPLLQAGQLWETANLAMPALPITSASAPSQGPSCPNLSVNQYPPPR